MKLSETQETKELIYFDHAGPMISYTDGMLVIEDLNPEARIAFKMSKNEMALLSRRILQVISQ